MYIKDIAIGSEDNLTNKMLAYLDLDSGVLPDVTPVYPNNDTRALLVRVSGLQMTDDINYIGLGNILDEVTKIYGNVEPSRYINSTGVEGANQILWYSAKMV